ncbi:MAG: sigma-54-dependent Fis family transcriptional regulator, partial [Deltaproteobacteria bacterium]|nr:sigma-54-dependent Fis family transcriptional regulator [Deltaproteobacteria bacterium]
DEEVIGAADLPLGSEMTAAPSGGGNLLRVAVDRRMTLHELGDLYIEETLKQTGGNKVRAAKILGINRRTLYRRGERANAPKADEA